MLGETLQPATPAQSHTRQGHRSCCFHAACAAVEGHNNFARTGLDCLPIHQSCVCVSELFRHDRNGWSVVLCPCLHVGLGHVRSVFSVLKSSGSVTSEWCLHAVLGQLSARVSPAGSLPGCLGQLENLEVLHLAGNQLTGRFASAMPGFHLMDHPLQKPCTQNEQCSYFGQSCGLANVTIQAAAGVMYTRCCSAAMPYCLPVWPAASCHDIPRSHGCLVSLENGYSTGSDDVVRLQCLQAASSADPCPAMLTRCLHLAALHPALA